MQNNELTSFLSSIDLSTPKALKIHRRTEDHSLTAKNKSYIEHVDPSAAPANLGDIDPRFISERKSKANPNPRKPQAVYKDGDIFVVLGIGCPQKVNAAFGGTPEYVVADKAVARAAEGKEYTPTKKWVKGYEPVLVEGQFLTCTDGTPSSIGVTSRSGVLLEDINDATRLTLVGYTVDGLKEKAEEVGVTARQTTYKCEDDSDINPWDPKYEQFHSYAEDKREPVSPINLLAENILEIEVIGTWNPVDGTITK